MKSSWLQPGRALALLRRRLDAIFEPAKGWPRVRTDAERLQRYRDARDLVGSPDFEAREIAGNALLTKWHQRFQDPPAEPPAPEDAGNVHYLGEGKQA